MLESSRDERLDIVCIGGCHRDVVARSLGAFEVGTSCPGMVEERAGGVARNVAVLLAGAGLAVGLVGRVGEDSAGAALTDGVKAAGVAGVELRAEPGMRTGTYVAVHDDRGELVAAVSDLGIYDLIDPAELARSPLLRRAGFVFADANLSTDCLAWLAETFGERLAVDGISRAKVPRLSSVRGSDALMFLNLPSSAVLTGVDTQDTEKAADGLVAAGFRRFVLTGGPRPVVVQDPVRRVVGTVRPRSVVDVTGAGDALAAAVCAALVRAFSLEEALNVGIAAAAAAVETTGALSRLPDAVLEAVSGSGAVGASR